MIYLNLTAWDFPLICNKGFPSIEHPEQNLVMGTQIISIISYVLLFSKLQSTVLYK